jgi:hypothetical protein
VILGVDSAVTVPVGDHVKIWENAEKLFQLGEKPIGIAIYGLAGFADRSVGSYFRQFEKENPGGVLTSENDLSIVVESLRNFMHTAYHANVVPAIQAAGRDFNQDLQAGNVPVLGMVIGGFSSGQYLPELWNVVVPYHAQANSAQHRLTRGQIGVTWYSMYEPIMRYIHGYDAAMVMELTTHVEGLFGRPFTQAENDALAAIRSKYQYTVPFASMPIDQGTEYVRFLVDHHQR